MASTQRKIIYVDDVRFSLLSVKSRFKDLYEIHLVQSAFALFEVLENFKPDLILLDINMPGLNGYDTIQRLKADKRYADIPVIFLTARDDCSSLFDGAKFGAADYIRKPFSDEVLIESIEKQFRLDPPKVEVELPKIIYVDDVNYNLLSVKSRFKANYTIYPTQTVSGLFERLENIKPDLILLDIEMPKENGFDAIKKLKADGRYADIPVIFLTGRDDKESVLEGIKLGAADYIRKPFSDIELIRRVDFQLNVKKGGGNGDSAPIHEPVF